MHMSPNKKKILQNLQYKPKHMHKHQTQNFRRISLFDLAPAKKAHEAKNTLVSSTLRSNSSNVILTNIIERTETAFFFFNDVNA